MSSAKLRVLGVLVSFQGVRQTVAILAYTLLSADVAGDKSFYATSVHPSFAHSHVKLRSQLVNTAVADTAVTKDALLLLRTLCCY